MNLTCLYNTPRPLVTLLLVCGFGMSVSGQETDLNQRLAPAQFPRVDWVKNWPSEDSRQVSKNFRNRFSAIVFGTKTPRLSNPVAVFAISPDNFLVLDQANKTVFQVEKGVGDITHPVLKTNMDLSSLVGICQGPNGSRLFTDSHAQKIYRISPESKKLQYMNDSLTLEQPTGIAYSALKREIWVVETKSHCISVINEKGERIKRIGHRGSASGEFNYPTHIWIDTKGYVYITDAMNFRIQVLNPDGEVISAFGEAGDASGFLARPKGVATDSFGNIYVVDALFNVVQVFDINGNFLYKFGSQGHGNGEFWMPSGIFIDAENYIYVADTYNSRVQIFQLTHSPGK
jgi:DNA-binding beta-propeller fold protein YncE